MILRARSFAVRIARGYRFARRQFCRAENTAFIAKSRNS
jgi:hypothetical protein